MVISDGAVDDSTLSVNSGDFRETFKKNGEIYRRKDGYKFVGNSMTYQV